MEDMRRGLRDLISRKMNRSYECRIEDKNTKEVFFIKSYDGGKTYNLYRGCNLVVGDVNIDYIVSQICSIHNDLTNMVIKNVYIEKWGGCVDVNVIRSLDVLPQGSRYIGYVGHVSKRFAGNLDIYESEDGVIYGLRE